MKKVCKLKLYYKILVKKLRSLFCIQSLSTGRLLSWTEICNLQDRHGIITINQQHYYIYQTPQLYSINTKSFARFAKVYKRRNTKVEHSLQI